MNQTEYHLVHNQEKNYQCDHIPFNLKGIGNPFFKLQRAYRGKNWSKPQQSLDLIFHFIIYRCCYVCWNQKNFTGDGASPQIDCERSELSRSVLKIEGWNFVCVLLGPGRTRLMEHIFEFWPLLPFLQYWWWKTGNLKNPWDAFRP